MTRRSSTRRAPGRLRGSSGSIAAHCASLTQNRFAIGYPPASGVDAGVVQAVDLGSALPLTLLAYPPSERQRLGENRAQARILADLAADSRSCSRPARLFLITDFAETDRAAGGPDWVFSLASVVRETCKPAFVVLPAVEYAENQYCADVIIDCERNRCSSTIVCDSQSGPNVVTANATMWKGRERLAVIGDCVCVAGSDLGRGGFRNVSASSLSICVLAPSAKMTV